MQDYLGTSQFPSAHFVSTNVNGLPSTYASGQTITFQIVGNLTLHGVTNQETFQASRVKSAATRLPVPPRPLRA